MASRSYRLRSATRAERRRAALDKHPGQNLQPESPAYLDYGLMLSQRVQDTTTSRRAEVRRAAPPMFASPLLDALSRVHPAVPVVIFVPAIAVLAATALGGIDAPTTAA